jgi:hypothetical protein
MYSKAKIYGGALTQRLNGNYYVVYFILFLCLCYIGYLSFSIHEGIFYAGDQALKCLQVKQIAAGYGFKYLHLPQPDWVKSVWNAGYFPLKPPFFYPSPNGYLIVYPPLFQIINAPLYSMFGSPGLYILPLLCTLILLAWTIFLLKRCGITPIYIALALFILVFCSPLILYGVMFWEHLPAVLLLFAGLSFIAATPSKFPAAITLALVCGLAIWLRPEALMMIFLYGLAVIVLYLRERKKVFIAFAAALVFSLIPWLVFNKIEYGSIFGIHGMQVLSDNDPETSLGWKNGWRNLIAINSISIRTFLFILLLFPILYKAIISRTTNPRPALLAAIVILYSILTPFMLPNDGIVQWGARYFLAIIPITLVALFLAEKEWITTARRRIPLWLTLFIIAISLNSFYLNTHGGGYKELRWRYNKRITPIYNLLDKKPGNVVIVSNNGMSYDFGYLFDKNYFFFESGDDSLRRLLPLLKHNGVHEYIYIFNPRIPTLPKMLEDSSTRYYWDAAAAAAARHEWIKDDYAFKIFTIH